MTKVAPQIVKMVEPLFDLIDFEEEIKVEKISKEECKTPEISSVDLNNSDEDDADFEIDLYKKNNKSSFNLVEKTKTKQKHNESLRRKSIFNKLLSEFKNNSSTEDSNSSLISIKSNKSENKNVAARRTSHRKTKKDENLILETFPINSVEASNDQKIEGASLQNSEESPKNRKPDTSLSKRKSTSSSKIHNVIELNKTELNEEKLKENQSKAVPKKKELKNSKNKLNKNDNFAKKENVKSKKSKDQEKAYKKSEKSPKGKKKKGNESEKHFDAIIDFEKEIDAVKNSTVELKIVKRNEDIKRFKQLEECCTNENQQFLNDTKCLDGHNISSGVNLISSAHDETLENANSNTQLESKISNDIVSTGNKQTNTKDTLISDTSIQTPIPGESNLIIDHEEKAISKTISDTNVLLNQKIVPIDSTEATNKDKVAQKIANENSLVQITNEGLYPKTHQNSFTLSLNNSGINVSNVTNDFSNEHTKENSTEEKIFGSNDNDVLKNKSENQNTTPIENSKNITEKQLMETNIQINTDCISKEIIKVEDSISSEQSTNTRTSKIELDQEEFKNEKIFDDIQIKKTEQNIVDLDRRNVEIPEKIEIKVENQNHNFNETQPKEDNIKLKSQETEDRFFIFDETFEEEENSACNFNPNQQLILNMNDKICGEIIHKNPENFSINCYMCWDDENWTFKKFSDMKAFSVHLNNQHSDEQIDLQNQRGNSFSLDFVNHNSCVMPQPMWTSTYDEMISLKCGFAKIDSNGFIHYSCLECKHDFKNFNAFTKHIMKRSRSKRTSESNEDNSHSDANSPSNTCNAKVFSAESNDQYKDYNNFKSNDITDISGLNSSLVNQKGNNINLTAIDAYPNEMNEETEDIHKNPVMSNEQNAFNEIVSQYDADDDFIPDTFGYHKIASALLSIFDDQQQQTNFSSKLDQILAVGQDYFDIREKERQAEEEKEKPNEVISKTPKTPKNKSLDTEKTQLLTCNTCHRQYTCLTILREHYRIHSGDRIVMCTFCNRGFLKKSNLEEHRNIFHVGTEYKDIDINELGDNRRKMAFETKPTFNEDNPKEKGLKCRYCPKFLTNRSTLEDHLKLHLGEKPIKCNKCDLKFLKKSIYDCHIKLVHEEDDLVHDEVNNINEEVAQIREDTVAIHNVEHTDIYKTLNKKKGVKKSKFRCKQCSEFYPTRPELIKHLVSRHNNSEFKCKYCSQTFDIESECFSHETLHENGSKYQCSICQQCCTNLFSLELHDRTHKKISVELECRFCDNSFVSEKTKQLHEENHTEVGDKIKKVQTVDIATILQMNNEQVPITSNGNTNDSNGTSSDATDRSSNQNTTSTNLMVKKIIKKIRRSRRDPNLPLDCRYCKKHFESPHQLSYHERLHEIGKKFQCNVCDKTLASSYALELHLTAHLKKKKVNDDMLNNKVNGSTILADQLAMVQQLNQECQIQKPKIEIVSDVTLAPNQTIEILNNFFKRETPTMTVTTTSHDESFQKIGVDDIEKNLTAHVLRDTDPYYQLMADFSYQYEMYSNKNKFNECLEPSSATECNLEENDFTPNYENIEQNSYQSNEQNIQPVRKGRKKKLLIENQKENSQEIDKNHLNDQSDMNQTQTNFDTSLAIQTNYDRKKEKKRIAKDALKNANGTFIKCEYCTKKYNITEKKSLDRHRRLHIVGDTHKCSFCQKCFVSMYYLDKHLKIHHREDIVHFKCDLCPFEYALREALRRHIQRVHKEVDPNSNRDLNDKIDNNENLTASGSLENPADETNIKNSDPEFAVPEAPPVSKKRRSRSKELKPFDCDFCEKSFSTSLTLQTHVERIHKKNMENFEDHFKFKCAQENCSKKFECQTNLDRHIRLHELGLKCTLCGKKLTSQILLDHHMKSHGWPESYNCQYCTTKFTLELSREIHERKVHSREHNLSYSQITEALSSASTGLTAIKPVEVIESSQDDDQQMTTELTPLTTLTSLTTLTPLTPLQPTAVFHHNENDPSILQPAHHSDHLHQLSNPSAIEGDLTSMETSTISEVTKLSLTLLDQSALCEFTELTQPEASVPTLTDLSSAYNDQTTGGLLQQTTSVLTAGEYSSTISTRPFESHLITTQCNNNTSMLNISSASSDYAVTNMDTSQITQQSKKQRICDGNIPMETNFTMLDDSSVSQLDCRSQSDLTNFSTFDGTTDFLSSHGKNDPVSNHMTFTDLGLSAKSENTTLEPLMYTDSMPLSEGATILELTSSSQPSSEATGFSEANAISPTKKKRNSGNNKPFHRPKDSEIVNLEDDFDTSLENNHFKCTLCRRVFDCWQKFRKHNDYHVVRPYQCPICPCNFKTNEELLAHNKVHENTENSFPCEVCNRVFISKSRLKAHTVTVHNEERQFKCDYCPSAFKTKSRLVDHVRSHTGEKPIKCHYCDEHFSRAAYRLKHERAIHPELLEIDTKHKEEKMKEKKEAAAAHKKEK